MTDHSLDVRAVAEAVADVLAERGLVVHAAPGAPARVLNAADVAHLLGRKPAWVYAHAVELGAIRFGDGPRARLAFDAATIEQWKRERQIRPPAPNPTSRRLQGRRAVPRGGNLIPYEPAAVAGA